MILGGCSSESDGDVQPTLSSDVEISRAVAPGKTCRGTPGIADFVVYPAGRPLTVVVKSESVTESCRCEFTTTAPWSCSGSKECESDYDLGGPNPVKCERAGAVPATLPAVGATVDRQDCTAVVTVKDESQSDVTVTCATAGPAMVIVTVAGMRGEDATLDVLFTEEGACPASDDEAGADGVTPEPQSPRAPRR